MTRLVIVGGSDAGISAGLRARELDPTVEPTLVVADAYPNFSICGIPYWLSGEVSDRQHLAHRTREDLERAGLDLRLDTVAERIDAERRELTVRTSDLRAETIEYDRLVIATGAVPARPPIPGIELAGVHLLHWMGDATAVQDALNAGARSAVIIGAGYIGVEMADALIRRGVDISVIEQAPSALTTADPELGALVVDELTAHGVRCSIGARVTGIEPSGDRHVVTAEGGVRTEGQIVLVLAGVQPDTQLAGDAGASLGVRGAIAVDRQMRTGLPDIWAAPTTNCSTSPCTCHWAIRWRRSLLGPGRQADRRPACRCCPRTRRSRRSRSPAIRPLRPRPGLHAAALLPMGPGTDRLPSLGTSPVPQQDHQHIKELA